MPKRKPIPADLATKPAPTMSLGEFCERLTEICDEAIHHGFYAVVAAPQVGTRQIDVTVPTGWEMRPKCFGKRHQLVFSPEVPNA